MAMFKVEAGKSFHSIQEVFTSEKPRMSLQGWFHGPLPEAETKARPTLAMLQTILITAQCCCCWVPLCGTPVLDEEHAQRKAEKEQARQAQSDLAQMNMMMAQGAQPIQVGLPGQGQPQAAMTPYQEQMQYQQQVMHQQQMIYANIQQQHQMANAPQMPPAQQPPAPQQNQHYPELQADMAGPANMKQNNQDNL